MRDSRSKELAPSEKAAPQFQGIGSTSKDLPRSLRKEIAAFARNLKGDHRALFSSDPAYRKRAGQFLTALLPPKPKRRGRPGIPSVTKAIALLKKYRREHRGEKPEQLWRRIYPAAISNYDAMSEVQKRDARAELIARVKDRTKKQKRRARRSNQGN
jgi:hypothetical protein